MKAEDKARELVEKFKPFMYCYIGSGMLSNDYNEKIVLHNAKDCASIAVDEILSNVSLSDKAYDLWQEVKSHINKL